MIKYLSTFLHCTFFVEKIFRKYLEKIRDNNNNNNNNIYFRTSCKYYTNIVYELSSQNYMLA